MANLHLLGFVGLGVSFCAAILLPLSSGCGSSTGSNTGGSNVGGSHAGGSHAGGNHAGGSHAGGSNVGGGTNDCAALAKNEAATPVPVRLVNSTKADLYIRFSDSGNCAALPFTIKDPAGDELPWANDGLCTHTCADFDCVCTATCVTPPIVRITPNGSADITWKGVVREDRTLPASCIEPSSFCVAGEPCRAEVAPKTFPLSFVSTAWTFATCGGAVCTPCTPNASGSCELDGSGLSGDLTGEFLQGTATYSSGDTKVDIVFTAP